MVQKMRDPAQVSIDAAVEFGISISKLDRIEQNKIPLRWDVACAAAHLYTCKLEDFSAPYNRNLPPKGRLHIN